MPNSSNSCDVGTDFLIFLLPLPLPLALLFAIAIATSCDSCDALSREGLHTRPERRGSGLELSVSFSVELSDELSIQQPHGD
jgi:hypothetical protein